MLAEGFHGLCMKVLSRAQQQIQLAHPAPSVHRCRFSSATTVFRIYLGPFNHTPGHLPFQGRCRFSVKDSLLSQFLLLLSVGFDLPLSFFSLLPSLAFDPLRFHFTPPERLHFIENVLTECNQRMIRFWPLAHPPQHLLSDQPTALPLRSHPDEQLVDGIAPVLVPERADDRPPERLPQTPPEPAPLSHGTQASSCVLQAMYGVGRGAKHL
jgi:hypothetical protein